MQKFKPRLLLRFPSQTTRPRAVRHFATEARATADHVRIVEVGPRDGLQNEKKSISLETKLELIKRLAKTGVTTIEAGSFVPAKWVPQVCSSKCKEFGVYILTENGFTRWRAPLKSSNIC